TRFSRDWSSDVCSSDLAAVSGETMHASHPFVIGGRVMLDRREFFKHSALATAAGTLTATSRSRAAGANDRLRVGVIGLGGQGREIGRAAGREGEWDSVW